MRNQNFAFTRYFKMILKNLTALKREIKNTPAYEIADIKQNNRQYHILIQINGTGKFATYTLDEIISDDIFLNGFSITELRTLFKLYFDNLKKPEYMIVSQKYNKKENKFVFCLRKYCTGETLELAAAEIFANKDILMQCSPEDAYRIGYSCAIHQ